MSLMSLPSDALLTILFHLHPSDITRLQAAFPPLTTARSLTRDPHLWHILYRRHFPPASGPHPKPLITITVDGRLDWQTAYLEAERRRQAISLSRQPPYPRHNPRSTNHHSLHSSASTSHYPNLRVEVRGNIHRIVSDTAHRSSAKVVWDHSIAAARFDWTARSIPPPSNPTRNPQRTDVATLRRSPPNPPSESKPKPDTQTSADHSHLPNDDEPTV